MSFVEERLFKLVKLALSHDRPEINILVHGEAGCGKTTLITRLKQLLRERTPEIIVRHFIVSGTLEGTSGLLGVSKTLLSTSTHLMEINLYEIQTCPTEEAVLAQNTHFRVAFTRELFENPPNIMPKREDRFGVHIYHYI